MRYVAAADLRGRPHVIVDGAPRPGTVCTLSHWPRTPTPTTLRADLSAQITLRALEHPELVPDVEIASIDHVDEDGLVSLALLTIEGLAGTDDDLLVEAARVGDFGVVTRRDAALVSFALGAVDDPGSAMALLPDLVRRPQEHEGLWRAEADAFDAATEAIRSGAVTVEERPEHDLAVVRIGEAAGRDPMVRRLAWAEVPLHHAAVHSATDCGRVAWVGESRYELRFRYESWVRLQSHRARPRVDLSALAERFNEREEGGSRWVFDGAGAITPALHLHDTRASSMTPSEFLDALEAELAELDAGPPAWDPYGEPSQ
jgi:Family of unknown function (DUF6687)